MATAGEAASWGLLDPPPLFPPHHLLRSWGSRADHIFTGGVAFWKKHQGCRPDSLGAEKGRRGGQQLTPTCSGAGGISYSCPDGSMYHLLSPHPMGPCYRGNVGEQVLGRLLSVPDKMPSIGVAVAALQNITFLLLRVRGQDGWERGPEPLGAL